MIEVVYIISCISLVIVHVIIIRKYKKLLNDKTCEYNTVRDKLIVYRSENAIYRKAVNQSSEIVVINNSKINELTTRINLLEDYVASSKIKFGNLPEDSTTDYPYNSEPTVKWSPK